MALAYRLLARGRMKVHLIGVETYTGASGGDELFAFLHKRRPAAVLMESFAVPNPVPTGAPVPYREHLRPDGLERAFSLVADPSFRAQWSCEAVCVLTALRTGADVVFADRAHAISFDRLVARCSVPELRSSIVQAVELFASAVEAGRDETRAEAEAAPWWGTGAMQNVLTPTFPELWGERHLVMAHVTRRLSKQLGQDIALVVGSRHVEPLAGCFEEKADKTADVQALLQAPDDPDTFDKQVEKRAMLAALLAATQTFPADLVLPNAEDLLPEARKIAGPIYTKYRQAINSRLGALFNVEGKSDSIVERLGQSAAQAHGLAHLEELCGLIAK